MQKANCFKGFWDAGFDFEKYKGYAKSKAKCCQFYIKHEDALSIEGALEKLNKKPFLLKMFREILLIIGALGAIASIIALFLTQCT